MECGLNRYAATTNGGGASPPGILAGEVRGGGGGGGGGAGERSPARSGLHVNFKDKGEIKEKREKFLTAKYGHHQMSLIRKRLAVEMWLYEELKKLYQIKKTNDDSSSDEVEIDIDELLDMDGEDERKKHVQSLLTNAKASQSDVNKFINELLDKAKTL